MSEKYVLLDRDGTVIVEKDYLGDPAGVELLPGAASGMKKMQDAGFKLIIVTNQSGIGRGYYSEQDYLSVTQRLEEILRTHGITLAGVYHCPHAPDDNCTCRKPKTGMADQAARDHAIDFADSIMIGDKPADINLGIAIGAKTILVRTGYGKKHEASKSCEPDYIAADLEDSAKWIISEQNKLTPELG